MYCGWLGKHGLSLARKLGLHPSAFAHLSTMSSCWQKLAVLVPELGIGRTLCLFTVATYYLGQRALHTYNVILSDPAGRIAERRVLWQAKRKGAWYRRTIDEKANSTLYIISKLQPSNPFGKGRCTNIQIGLGRVFPRVVAMFWWILLTHYAWWSKWVHMGGPEYPSFVGAVRIK